LTPWKINLPKCQTLKAQNKWIKMLESKEAGRLGGQK
jgi:hypothetical protein